MSEDLLSLFDRAPLNRRYWFIFALMAAVFMFDFFDFVIVGYLLAAVAPEWRLTYGQSAVILYSGGIGAIAGAVLFGALADEWGRKKQIVVGTMLCAISSGLIAFIPNDAWLLFAILRFLREQDEKIEFPKRYATIPGLQRWRRPELFASLVESGPAL